MEPKIRAKERTLLGSFRQLITWQWLTSRERLQPGRSDLMHVSTRDKHVDTERVLIRLCQSSENARLYKLNPLNPVFRVRFCWYLTATLHGPILDKSSSKLREPHCSVKVYPPLCIGYGCDPPVDEFDLQS